MSQQPAEHVAALLERLGRLVSTEGHTEGLLPVQWEALRYLGKANRFSRTPAALTAYLGLTKGTVSQSLNTLESRGLIRKQVDRKDRRSKHLSLTRKGEAVLRKDPIKQMVPAIGQLTQTSQGRLAKTLEEILHHRLSAQDRQPFGQCRDCRYFAKRHDEGKPHYCQLLSEPLVEGDAVAICVEQSPR